MPESGSRVSLFREHCIVGIKPGQRAIRDNHRRLGSGGADGFPICFQTAFISHSSVSTRFLIARRLRSVVSCGLGFFAICLRPFAPGTRWMEALTPFNGVH